ncbi:MAG TPA: PEP-CTERM sorting domain-containing protein [Sedimentisphaerales bacterium]|nr:PEP-CTERM sorting domain-containing protein [Sedimentisphaerales bacterium]
MFKKLLLLVVALLLAGAPSVFAGVGVFDFTGDVGAVGGYGVTTTIGGVYEIIAGGSDIWGSADQFHYAYKQVSGNVRFELTPMWEVAPDYWSKIETMIRVDTSTGSVAYATATRRQDQNTTVVAPVSPGPWVGAQIRSVANNNMWGGTEWGGQVPQKIGSQRVVSNGYQVVQSLVDFGGGWQNLDTRLVPSLPDEILLGAAVTSHNNNALARAQISNVAYTANPDLVGIKQAGDPLPEACGDVLGFLVSAAKMPPGWTFWNEGDGERPSAYRQAEYLAKNSGFTGYFEGDPTEYPSLEFGTEYRRFVNLADAGEGRAFHAGNGFPDAAFPGVDDWVYPDPDPDGDDQFAVVVEACIELTEGLHVLGGAFDDGVLIRIGGVEIGRTNDWNETSAWVFEAPTAGHYSLEAVGYEMGGGAFMELYEYLPNGTMILLGDVANGGSPVYVPEPATIALLGFGGLSMLRIRRKR